jgi:hypothetical protein
VASPGELLVRGFATPLASCGSSREKLRARLPARLRPRLLTQARVGDVCAILIDFMSLHCNRENVGRKVIVVAQFRVSR